MKGGEMMKTLRIAVLAIAAVGLVLSFAFAADVARGKAMFSDPKLGTTGKSCSDCHKDGKGLEGAADKKEFFKDKKKMTFEEAVNFCVVNGIKGKELKGDDLADMVAYMKTFKATPEDKPKKKKVEGC
jgi:mono/diheme cytochrome c family protein